MRRYCLTKCFKRKMSNVGEAIITFLAVIGIFFALALIFAGLSALLGLLGAWLNEYFDGNAKEKTIVNMEIIYFNSSSSKLFFDIFDIFDEAKNNHRLEINWIYDKENESALEAGEDFVDDFEYLNINLVEKI